MSLGCVQLLQRLGVWSEDLAQPIDEVHVSQAPPALPAAQPFGAPEVRIRAADEGAPMLGAVLSYGQLVEPLRQAWQAAVRLGPQRLVSRFGAPVNVLKELADGVDINPGIAEHFGLGVVAVGGVFAGQLNKALAYDHRQPAWVDTLTLDGGTPGLAIERFTWHGPLALLPLRPRGAEGSAGVVRANRRLSQPPTCCRAAPPGVRRDWRRHAGSGWPRCRWSGH